MATKVAAGISDLAAIDPADYRYFTEQTWPALFARLRAEDPVHYCTEGMFAPYWSVTRYKDIVHVEAHTAKLFHEDYCLMFLDGAGWHRANDLRVPPNIRLLPLPPYSPELNPVEHVWDYLRENHFANRALNSLDEVEELLCQSLHQLIFSPDLVRSMTAFNWLITIPLTSN